MTWLWSYFETRIWFECFPIERTQSDVKNLYLLALPASCHTGTPKRPFRAGYDLVVCSQTLNYIPSITIQHLTQVVFDPLITSLLPNRQVLPFANRLFFCLYSPTNVTQMQLIRLKENFFARKICMVRRSKGGWITNLANNNKKLVFSWPWWDGKWKVVSSAEYPLETSLVLKNHFLLEKSMEVFFIHKVVRLVIALW